MPAVVQIKNISGKYPFKKNRQQKMLIIFHTNPGSQHKQQLEFDSILLPASVFRYKLLLSLNYFFLSAALFVNSVTGIVIILPMGLPSR
jgi:hypothetical protein